MLNEINNRNLVWRKSRQCWRKERQEREVLIDGK